MDPAECLSVLESRYVLVDIVQTVAGTLTPIRAVRDAFMALLLAKDAAAMQRGRKELGVELGKIDFRLSQRNEAGPFVEGPDLTMGDFELACTLYHMRIALNYFRNWSLPTKFEQLTRYAAEMHDMEVFKQIAPTPEAIIRRYEDMGVKVAAAKSA
jgi:glutathione S-transferase